MPDMGLAYPLHWPHGWDRTRTPQRSAFSATFATAVSGVLRELDLLGASNITISSNIPLRQDGFPKANWRQPEDAGVAVYFLLDGESRCIPCDKWHRVKDNLRAIEKTIEAMRGISRWGADAMMQAAFAGFAALPESAPIGWWRVLEVDPRATEEEIRAAYHRLAKIHHPDAGGSSKAFHDLYDAFSAGMHDVINRKRGFHATT